MSIEYKQYHVVFQPANKWFNLPTWVIAVEFVCSFKTRRRFLNSHANCIVRVSSIFKSLLFAVRTSAVATAFKELSNNDHFYPLLFSIIIFNMKSSHFLLSKINTLDRDFLHGQIVFLVCPLRNHITLILSHHSLTLSLANVAKGKCWPNFQISCFKILTNK